MDSKKITDSKTKKVKEEIQKKVKKFLDSELESEKIKAEVKKVSINPIKQ